VAVTRRAYRDGQNEYLLNGQKVRLRDISELLAQSGLSERTYSIIGQGLIDNSLALRPDERRKLFEEAAGIGLYRGRRNESLNRLEVTRRNMERVNDILAELEPRIHILERQAKKAIDYERIKADLRLVLKEWYGYHWFKSQEEITESREYQEKQEQHLAEVKGKHEEINKQIGNIRFEIQTYRERINELHARASSLHNEKEAISKDLAVREERLRSLTEQVYSYELDITRLEEEIQAGKASLDEISEESVIIKEELAAAIEKESTLREKIRDIQSSRDGIDKVIRDIRTKILNLENNSIKSQAQVEEKNNRKLTLQNSLTAMTKSIDELEKVYKKGIQEFLTQEMEIKDIQKNLSQVEENLEEKIKKSDVAKTEINLLYNEKQILEQTASKLRMEIEMLEQAEQNLVGYPSGAKSLLQSIRKGDLGGFASALSSQMIVAEEYEHAIGVALGEFADAILLNKNSEPDKALLILESEQNGRTAIIPEGWIKSTAKIKNPDKQGCIGVALDLISYPDELKGFYELLLSRVLIISERKYARGIIQEIPDDVTLVTLKGEIFYPNGKIIGGKGTSNTHISRPRQISDLRNKLDKITPELENASEVLSVKQNDYDALLSLIKEKSEEKRNLDVRFTRVNNDFQNISALQEKSKRQLDWNSSQHSSIQKDISGIIEEVEYLTKAIEENKQEVIGLNSSIKEKYSELNQLNIDDLRRDLSYLQTTIAVNRRALDEINKRINEKSEQTKNGILALELIREKFDKNKSAISDMESSKKDSKEIEVQKNLVLEDLQREIEPAEAKLKEHEKKYNNLLVVEESNQQLVNNAEKYNTQAQMDLFRKKESIDALRRRIEEDFGLVDFDYGEEVSGPTPLPIEGMVEQLPFVKEITPELEENITRQKSMLRRLGSVNPEAKEEYDSTKERFDFLTQQINDLNLAEQNLRQILADLDTLMKSEFQKTFIAVSEEFPKMFNKLFGGGSARLDLSNPDDLNESGIEVHARLPGKREQELTLLSGGERSLTAVALIFALLKISPTPFCVLDEVDAMLDESNVGRFRELLLELSQDIQFILVTHNRNTVQAANVIYGVTMGRDSTSQMVSLKLDEVPEDILSKRR
jgi:chromosome segregation protein